MRGTSNLNPLLSQEFRLMINRRSASPALVTMNRGNGAGTNSLCRGRAAASAKILPPELRAFYDGDLFFPASPDRRPLYRWKFCTFRGWGSPQILLSGLHSLA